MSAFFGFVLGVFAFFCGNFGFFPNAYALTEVNLQKISEVEKYVTSVINKIPARDAEVKGEHVSLTSAAQLLLITDVDGVLTSEARPGEPSEVYARGQSTETSVTLIQRLHGAGAQIVASSAWPIFEQTMERIQRLGLGLEFQAEHGVSIIDESVSITHDTTDAQFSFLIRGLQEPLSLSFFRAGNVVSVKSEGSHYRQKALSPYFISGIREKIDLGLVTEVVFVDDSLQNIDIFRQDVERFGLFAGMEVHLITLGDPRLDQPFGSSVSSPDLGASARTPESTRRVRPALARLQDPHLQDLRRGSVSSVESSASLAPGISDERLSVMDLEALAQSAH